MEKLAVQLNAAVIADQAKRTNDFETFLRNNQDHRKIVKGPDLKGMQDSLTIGENIGKMNNPMVGFRLAKDFNGLHNVHVAIMMMRREDQTHTDAWEFEGTMTYDESDSIGQHRGVTGHYNTRTRTGYIRFYERMKN